MWDSERRSKVGVRNVRLPVWALEVTWPMVAGEGEQRAAGLASQPGLFWSATVMASILD